MKNMILFLFLIISYQNVFCQTYYPSQQKFNYSEMYEPIGSHYVYLCSNNPSSSRQAFLNDETKLKLAWHWSAYSLLKNIKKEAIKYHLF